MKKKLFSICLLAGVLLCLASKSHAIKNITCLKTTIESRGKLSQDILISILHPYAQKAITDYYKNYLKIAPVEDPWFIKILRICRIADEPDHQKIYFLVELKAAPYIGPHNSVGVDYITFKIQDGKVSLAKFKHVKSFPIAPNYQDIIKAWPPS
ncbi:MAG: DUF3888 domain-containing protein [Bacillota bacterium]|nr:DUF3888 domain-containing protein [Bacillota bacterium]